MTTIEEAIRRGDARVSISGRLVCKHLFHKGPLTLLIMLIVDRRGVLFEAKTWRKLKAYTVFGKFREGDHVLLSVDTRDLTGPNKKYTQAEYVTARNNWHLGHADGNQTNPAAYFNCWTNVMQYRMNKERPAESIMGLFRGWKEGPPKYWRGRRVAQGYYVTLIDDDGHQFVALVWKSLAKNRAYKFALDECVRNDRILIVNAREQAEAYRDRLPDQYVVTTVYPPVLNSTCVSPGATRALAEDSQQTNISNTPHKVYALTAVACAN